MKRDGAGKGGTWSREREDGGKTDWFGRGTARKEAKRDGRARGGREKGALDNRRGFAGNAATLPRLSRPLTPVKFAAASARFSQLAPLFGVIIVRVAGR